MSTILHHFQFAVHFFSIHPELGKIKAIDRDVVDRFIEKITISKEGRIELELKFENIFQDVKGA